ncbi:MAG: hypothetical protein ACD_75C01023G0001 [uncultured bacterium]|nr:MAG: hypothetical protein ACD_75C01023G0001 [uncultured bacterium]
MFAGIEPQNLGAAGLLGDLRHEEGGGIIACGLHIAHAAFHGPDILIADVNLGGIASFGIIGANRRHDDVKIVGGRRFHPEHGFDGDHRRPDVEGRPFRSWYPFLFQVDHSLERAHHLIHGKARHAHPQGRIVHPFEIVFRSKQEQLIVFPSVSLQSLENCLAVMEDHTRRIQLEILIRADPGIVPAIGLIPFHQEHMIGKVHAESELVRIRFFLQLVFVDFFQCNSKIFPHSANLLESLIFLC